MSDQRCIFDGCVATWKHWHGFLPGGYDNPADPEGVPIIFEGDDPDPDAVRDYNGAALPSPVPAMSDDGTPRTAAGRRLLAHLQSFPGSEPPQWSEPILAIEAEARALVTPDSTQPHGVSGLFHHAPGAPCVVCDRLVTPGPAPEVEAAFADIFEDLGLPRVDAKRLLEVARHRGFAIRAQGGGLDVERLAYALRRDDHPNDPDLWDDPHDPFSRSKAARLVEYERLSEADHAD